MKKIYHVVFLGPQGSGKGTQADLLSKKLKIPIISTGKIYREEAGKKTILGEQVASYMNQGRLVPDDITNSLIAKKLKQKNCLKGFILDGFPRTISQAEALEEIIHLTQAVLINISDKEAIYRIDGRIMCKCGAIYHKKVKPPQKEGVCDACGAKLFIRKDDSEELALRKRLAIYRDEINPIIDLYSNKGILCKIDGMGIIDDIFREILKIFKN